MVEVAKTKMELLRLRMEALGVKESDLKESFVLSGGHGGQNVNKTATCVQMVHTPTGLQVKCQQTRSQGLNRFIARRLLLDKIEERQKGFLSAKQQLREKIRRQKRRRSKRAQQRILRDKELQSKKKADRRPNWG